jgi:hypothetical protein
LFAAGSSDVGQAESFAADWSAGAHRESKLATVCALGFAHSKLCHHRWHEI